jgi:hypothetical protein
MDATPAIDAERIDEAVLALLYLGICDTRRGMARAWKSFDWDAMDRLYDKGLISDPRGRAKSVALTEQGLKRAEAQYYALFARREERASEA